MRFLVLVLGILMFDSALASAGKILFVAGSVSIERDAVKPAAVGDPVEIGDIIVTGARSRAQLLMADSAKFAIRASSRFRIDGFALPAGVNSPQATATAADGLFAASLLKGGFRTMSGAIGKTDPKAYEVRTPIGTLGIRGTDYWALFCRGDCTNVPGVIPGNPVRDGLYLGVNTGSIVFRNGRVEIALKAPDFLFIPLADANPEPLQTAPQFLLEDDAGTLQVSRGEPAGRAALSGAFAHFNDRRNPPTTATADTSYRNDGGADRPFDSPPSLAVGGTDSNGSAVILTDGQLPPVTRQSNLAWNDATLGAGTSAADIGTYALDASNFIAGFDTTIAPRSGAPLSATLAIGTAQNFDTGTDSATGLRWGRWSNGAATYTVAGGQSIDLPLATESLHWIVDSPFTRTPTLPATGTASFALVGNTLPTDDQGGVGFLGGASLAANFTNQTVQSAVLIDIGGATWYGSGSGTITANTVNFAGSYTQGAIGGTVPVGGTFNGFFSVPASGRPQTLGGAVSYSLSDSQGVLGIVNGVAAFAQSNQPTVVSPPGQQRRDITYATGALASSPTFTDVQSNPPTAYAVDSGLNLSTYLGRVNTGNGLVAAAFDRGTAATIESGANSLSLIRWGRWSGGTASYTGAGGANPIDLTQKSLHWVMSGDASKVPTLPASGIATYTLIGNTTPTNSAGATGTLGTATLIANFGQQVVQSTLNLTMPTGSWSANGAGSIGAQAGLAGHQFAGNYAVNFVPVAGQPLGGSGEFTGFFAGRPVGAGGVPAGAGLTFSLTDDAGQNNVSGAAVFHGN